MPISKKESSPMTKPSEKTREELTTGIQQSAAKIDTDPETGGIKFSIEKGLNSFDLNSEKQRRTANEQQKLPQAILQKAWYNFLEIILRLMYFVS